MTVEYNFDTSRRQLNDNDDDNGQDVAIFSNMQVDVNAGINQAGVDHQLTAEEILAIIDEFGEVDDV